MHRPWQEVDVQEGGLTPLLCGCLSLGPPSDWQSAPLLQACGAWETVPALVTIRMTTWLTRNDRTHSALLPTALLITGYMSTRAQVRYSSLHPSVPRKASGFSEYGYRFGNCLCSISCVIVVHLGQVLSVRRIASPNVCSICTGVQESHTCRAGENRRWWTLQ